MLNYIWSAMILVSVCVSFATGRVGALSDAVCDGATEAVTLGLGIAGIMAFWTGLMKIAEKSGLLKIISSLLSPVITRLFPEAKKDKEAGGLISMNMTANIFGMGNAATPMGVSAMKRLSLHSRGDTASNSMCMLAVINSASIQLIPSTLIAVRSSLGSSAPSEITVPIWIVSAATFVFAVTLCRIMGCKK